MNFDTFYKKLKELEESIAISSPVSLQVKRAYWGAPPQMVTDLPAFINAISEPERILGFGGSSGGREQRLRVSIQLLAAKSTGDDVQNSRIATALWFAAKDAFDRDTGIGGTVAFSTLRGGEPTVPVILSHGGQSFIGFNAYLDIQDVESFDFTEE